MGARVLHATGIVPGDLASFRDGALVVDDAGTVLDLGPADELLPRHAGARVERLAGVIFPGLVNAHTHLELTGLEGSAGPGLGFAAWADRMIGARFTTPAEVLRQATETAVASLDDLATVAVGDVGNGLSAVPSLAHHRIAGALFHEVFGSSREAALAKVSAIEKDAAEHRASFEYGLRWAPSAHTLHTTHPEAVRALLALARRVGSRSSLHLAEHASEREALVHGRGKMVDFLASKGVPVGAVQWPGKGPIAYADELGALAEDVLLVHLADANHEELDLVAERGAHVVVCPRSNAWIEGNAPDLRAMFARGIAPALGTDSRVSSPSLDVLDEARAARRLAPELSPDQVVCMATWNGARALDLPLHGRFAKGSRPGVFLLPGDFEGSPSARLLDAVGAPRVRLDRILRESEAP